MPRESFAAFLVFPDLNLIYRWEKPYKKSKISPTNSVIIRKNQKKLILKYGICLS